MDVNDKHLDEYRVLRKIAAFIMENPNITVREIAQKLGYAEEKSVYYWLEKARFSGIKDFRRSVLTGTVPSGFLAREKESKPPAKGSVQDALSLADLPVREHFPVRSPGEKPLSQYLPLGFSPGSYLVPATEDLPAGLIRKGDLLLVDASSPIESGDLVLGVSESGEPKILRRYVTSRSGEVFVNLSDPGDTTSPAAVAGKIILLIRPVP
jgi:hypothetical protein